MISVNIEEETVINMLIDRLVEYWNPEDEVVELFIKMYENYAYSGCFSGDMCFDPKVIVDNDYINYCQVITKKDADFKKVKSMYKNNGCCDISCETRYSFIEAANKNHSAFLVRY